MKSSKSLNNYKSSQNRTYMNKLEWNEKFEKIFDEFEKTESKLVKVN